MTLSSIPFRIKVALILAGIILLLGVIAVTYARNDIRRILGTELERRGETIARNLASNSIDPLLTDDLYALYELVNRTEVSDADIRYILVISPEGTVRVSTFGSDAIP
ncbi:MAG: putative two-component histidine kinase, partial [Dehalococcoidia bacterium]|nr:putative two-component histidine kinase [Dehalococcoidia bacterium]